MKHVLWLVGMLLVSTALWAQSDCTQLTITSTDVICNDNTSDCPTSDHGCTNSAAFEATCTGNFDIDVWLTGCQSTHCKVCVKVEKSDSRTVVGSCVLDVCAEGVLQKTCTAAAALVQGGSYLVTVCLTHCLEDNCNLCTSCTAHGCLRGTQTSPCYP